ncbi:SGNH/GDSL hydrolase family protein [Cryomorpha ignava]|uniref:SGNH/GDSL hydrolase family protein n=2 Tax=Cryomorpha ignava TaxID=101383 RepID=A0A7K3WW22_9FLAO|nr:SGNH/GDSL hydrolase family protein [Cryomorpha ignava]
MVALISALLILFTACAKDSIDETVKTPAQSSISYLALGDSYTIGTSLADEGDSYPVKIADRLNAAGIDCFPPHIIAQNGWTTGDLLNATDAFSPDSTFDLVSLLIGVNNQYQGKSIDAYADEFKTLLKRAIQYAGNDTSKVFVISIPDYSVTPFGSDNAETIAKEIDQFNAVNSEITESYGISYFYITDISRQAANDPELIASDGLHPSGKMYELWVADFIEEIKMKTR